MQTYDKALADIAARHRGIVTRWAAVAAGIPEPVIDARIAAGILLVLFPGVYRHAATPPTREARWLAAVFAGGPGAVLSRRAAAVLHGVDGIRRVKPEVTVPFGRLPVHAGVTWHRARNLSPADRTVVDGIPTMALPRVLFELCGIPWLSDDVVAHAVQHAVITKKTSIEDLLAVLDRLGGRGVAGTVRFRAITAGGLPDDTIHSMLELLLDEIVAGAAIPPGIRQHPLTCADGRAVVLDRAWPDLRIAVEADGLRWHGTAAHHRATIARSRSIQGTGYLHLTYGWTDCKEQPLATRRELEAVFAPRLAA